MGPRRGSEEGVPAACRASPYVITWDDPYSTPGCWEAGTHPGGAVDPADAVADGCGCGDGLSRPIGSPSTIGPGSSTVAGGATGAPAMVIVPKSTFAAVSSPLSA